MTSETPAAPSLPADRGVLAADPAAPGAVFGRRDAVVRRRIAGEDLLVPVRRQVSLMRAVFVVTGAGGGIWDLLDGARPLAEVRDALVARYEVDAGRAWAELCGFVERLEERGLVERRS